MSLLNLFRVSEIKAPSSRFIKHCAFTLAEVLIVIGIIGIIADMTIPTLVSSYQEKVTVVALKKNYSEIQQAFMMAKADNGPMEYWDWGTAGSIQSARNVLELIKPYLRITAICGIEESGTGKCFPKDTVYKFLNGTDWECYDKVTETADGIRARLANGQSFYLFTRGNCEGKSGTGKILENVCGFYLIDINGDKKPNTLGRDTFYVTISQYGMSPAGSKGYNSGWLNLSTCQNATKYGYGCTAWVLYKENMDYLRRDVSWDE